MEITDRPELGEDLTAPQTRDDGLEYWSYSLVTETRPGDVVLHWHKDWVGEPAIVGWSVVSGPLAEGRITWQARGTSGRARGRATTGPSWVVPCERFAKLPEPVTKAMILRRRDQIKRIRSDLESRVGSSYFPFVFYKSGEVRAAQAYVTKFPAALLKAIPELATVPSLSPAARNTGSFRSRQLSGRRGRQQDPQLRRAIERHAVRLTKQHYGRLGANIEELGAPFDLRVLGLGPERHVEVKGSSANSAAVELTTNEVAHAYNHDHTDLVVVDQINWSREADGSYRTTGGRLRIWSDWRPQDDNLKPTRYLYELPKEDFDVGA